jgi:hypothetical protein
MARARSSLIVLLLVGLISPTAGARSTLDLPRSWSARPTPLDSVAAIRNAQPGSARFESARLELLTDEAPLAAVAAPEFVYPLRAGDLDDDGINDLVTVEFTGEIPVLRARHGLDGHELWNRSNVYLAQPVDLDDNGDGELLVASRVYTPTEITGVSTVEETIALLEGDGTPVWTFEVPGVFARMNDMESGLAADVEAVVSVRTMPDATGDGLDDVWVGTLEFAYVHQGNIYEARGFTGRSLDGATGDDGAPVPTAAVNGTAWGTPVSDLNGDGLADVITMGGATPETGVLAAHTGFGAPLWASALGANFGYLSAPELTGDGLGDALVLAFFDGASKHMVYSGANGSQLWAQTLNGMVDVAGDIDGDGGSDLISVEAFSVDVKITAIAGATGASLWGPVVSPSVDFTANCFCTNDLTGDGVWDPLTIEYTIEPFNAIVRAHDGASGTEMWNVSLPSNVGFPSPLGVDADGDGREDLVFAASDGSSLQMSVTRGTDRGLVWEATVPFAAGLAGVYGDDVTGDGAADLVLRSEVLSEDGFIGGAHAMNASGLLWSVP